MASAANRKKLRPNGTAEWEVRIEEFRVFGHAFAGASGQHLRQGRATWKTVNAARLDAGRERGGAMSWTINERLDIERQVVLNVCLDIARGVWKPGDALPAPSSLAQERILNPHIVESAFSRLAQFGLMTHTPDGAFVVAQDAVAVARTQLLAATREEVRDLVHRLRQAGVPAADIDQIWREATHD